MVMCFAPDCKHYSEKHGCRFFVFPKDPVKRKRWISLLRRKDREPSAHSLVCCCHFVDGNRQNGPTIFEHNKFKRFKQEPDGRQPKAKKSRYIHSFMLEKLYFLLIFGFMEKIPSRNKNKLCMPSCFNNFTNCRIILDCTEIYCTQPKNMEKQRKTYSSYKHRNTLKALIGVAPNGVVTYASELYPGSVSDKKIVQHCGILEQFVPGDLIIADKGFLISDILPAGVSLNIPPFLTTAQFTPQQVIQTRTIAKARIHVERAIRRIKCYKILSLIPPGLIPHASIVYKVCAALTNLQFPLIREVGDLFSEPED